jgi:hypothetical protein
MIVCDSAKNGEFAFHACHRLINLANKNYLFHVVICSPADFSDADPWRLRRIETEQTSMVIVATETTPPTAFWQWLRCWAIQPHPGPIGVYILGAETPVLFREHLMNFCEAAPNSIARTTGACWGAGTTVARIREPTARVLVTP